MTVNIAEHAPPAPPKHQVRVSGRVLAVDWALLCVLALMGCLLETTHVAAADQTSLKQDHATLLDRYARAKAPFARCSYSATCRVRGGSGFSDMSILAHRDDARYDISVRFSQHFRKDGSEIVRPKSYDTFRKVADGKGLFSYSFVGPDKSASPVWYSVNSESVLGHPLWLLAGGGAMEGVVGDSMPLDEVLRRATELVSRQSEAVDGHDCEVVTALVPEYGRYAIWFDPALDGLPRRVHIVKSASDRYGSGRVNENRVVWGEQSEHSSPMTQVVTTVDFKEFQEVGGRMTPVAWEHIEDMHGKDGRFTRVSSYRITKMDLDPVFEAGTFTPELPDGTPVQWVEYPRQKYFLVNGQVVSTVPTGGFRKIIFISGACLVGLVIAYVFMRSRRSTSQKR